LGDFNDELMLSYSTVRRHPRLTARSVHEHPVTTERYYAVRKLEPAALTPVERAARFIFLNRLCFNGIYRTNREGRFNVPMGRSTGSIPSEAAFVRCAYALRTATLVNDDFTATLRTVEQGDFVYLDPPYATSRATYGEYGYGAFSRDDLGVFVAELRRIDALGAKVVVSYRHDQALIDELPGWHWRPVTVRRDVAGAPRNRSDVTELLMWNAGLEASLVAPSSATGPNTC
jgi:DNA adenine methylase